MLRLQPGKLYRLFHLLAPCSGSQVKEKLKRFEKSSAILHKTSKELTRIKAKKNLELKNARKKAYSRQQAEHVLKTRYDISEDVLKNGSIGPSSESDTKYLTLVKDRKMLYTILGINGEQLRDSRLIADDVKKFLRRRQVEKAVFLARLAKKKGAAAMNAIMEYYLLELKFPQSAVRLYNWRKKWGIPPNEYTQTILFNGLAQQKQLISRASGEMVLRIVDSQVEKGELTQIEFNAALGALSNCTDVTCVFELFERKIDNIHRDAITFLWMIRACCRVQSSRLFKEIISGFMEKIPVKCFDSQLVFEYCKSISSRLEDKELKKVTLNALHTYFELDVDEKQLPAVPADLVIFPLTHWDIDRKFKISPNVIGLFLENCLECEEYKIGINFFRNLRDNKPGLLDLGAYFNYMDLLIRNYPTSCGEKCMEVFNEMESNGKLISTKHSLVLVYRAMLKQASKKYVSADVAKVENLLSSCQTFIKEQEGIYAKDFKEKIQPFQSWKFLLGIWKKVNVHNNISDVRVKSMIDDFAKSLSYGEFSIGSRKGKFLEDQRFVELEVVRLLKNFASRLELPNVEELDSTSPGPLRDIFLLRRLTLRMKDRLVEHIEMIERKQRDVKGVENLEWSLKQLAQKLLSSELPSISEAKQMLNTEIFKCL
ncbi:hypothetical protein HG535_0E03350 [Zygotorulaspora mrakii]|uniref:Mitochondrial group I intron splicing factor CCM1 n=1 Tax=Zygotorulaspora mrakii TaxID=42260 RepID=A0A7H9B3L7_ZYGMR|nr:uncharacterized protein HG535_0E03350 [Zygotorulaspora mrakii]QLG73251.1 hypothetical protein HG535_0E03350 [Zygotorulaspora mrakii]